jgi:hypothetical protein
MLTKTRFLLPIVQGAIAVAVALAGHWRAGLFLGVFAALLFLTGRLQEVDRSSEAYLRGARWSCRLVGVGFLVVGTLQAVGVLGYELVIAIPLCFIAGVAFIWMAQTM